MQRVTMTPSLFVDRRRRRACRRRSRRGASAGCGAKGQQVYAAQKCSVCHSIAGKGGKSRTRSTASARSSRPTTSAQWIVDPVAMAPKTSSTKKPPMPKKCGKLPAADLDALVAYMQSLK